MSEGGGKGGLSPKINPELLKPLVFPNNQRAFKIFNYVVAAVVVYYGVFVYEWPGKNENCFTWIRGWKERKKREIFHVDPSDPELQQHIREHTASSDRDR